MQSLRSVKDRYLMTVLNVCENVETHFEGIFDPPISASIELLLDTFKRLIMGDCGEFGNKEIIRLVSHLELLSETNGCFIEKISI